jgi:hypothetical protein
VFQAALIGLIGGDGSVGYMASPLRVTASMAPRYQR